MGELVCEWRILETLASGSVLEVTFRGVHDSNHGGEMDRHVSEKIKRDPPAAILFNLLDYEYEFGDDVTALFSSSLVREPRGLRLRPVCIVAAETTHTSLCNFFKSVKLLDACKIEFMSTVESALVRLRERLEEPLNLEARQPMTEVKAFQRPSRIEALFNRLIGMLVALGMGPQYMRVLDVRGRKSGRIFSTPVNLLELNGVQYLVAPRGNTHWVRNTRVAGRVRLRRGRRSFNYRVEEIPSQERPDVLKEYLTKYAREVQRYFSVEAGAAREAFLTIAAEHSVFRLHVTDEAV